MASSTAPKSKKRKFVADGVFYAELNELLIRELAEDGYSGVEVRVTPIRTDGTLDPFGPFLVFLPASQASRAASSRATRSFLSPPAGRPRFLSASRSSETFIFDDIAGKRPAGLVSAFVQPRPSPR